METKIRPNGKALLPFLIFLIFYLGSGIVLSAFNVPNAFYAVPASVSGMVGVLAAFLLLKGSIDEKADTFITGCGNPNIITMCIIYLLSGAFTAVASGMGGIESVVNLSLSVIPLQYVIAGIFLISFFIGTATGTSVGTVVALGPIAVGVAKAGGLSLPLMLASLIGGALAGDNLSIISDTTIAATRTMEVENRDKFLMNLKIVILPLIITTILLLIFGKPTQSVEALKIGSYSLIKILPYLFVLITAIMGMNVFLVLFSGLLIAGAIGMGFGSFNFVELSKLILEGFGSVLDIFILSMFTGGLAEMVKENGGIAWAIEKMKKRISDKKSAELAISGLTSVTDIATANNTVSILIVGQVAKEIGPEYKVDPRRSASLLDIFSCIFQGLIPYGAQILIACSYAGNISPISIIPYSWYLFLLAIFAIASIYINYSKAKTPWNFDKNQPMTEEEARSSQTV